MLCEFHLNQLFYILIFMHALQYNNSTSGYIPLKWNKSIRVLIETHL